ncbi:MAG: Mannosyltransferase [Phycisphaerales bacterium]|nr:Mannosyltransferase [Phycisphaerales bacterium]
MIPKLIHQTAKTADIDDRSKKYQALVRKMHPDWTYKLWTDADNDAFVRAEFPDFYPTFAGLPKGIMRADVIRYLLMDKLGGLYLDLDYEVLRPFDRLNFGCVVPLESSGEWGEGNDVLGNAYFAAAPGHPFFRRVLDVIQNRPQLTADANVLTTTGPAFITSVYRSMSPAEQAQVSTPPRSEFNPKSPRNEREYQTILADKSVYGIHHCHGSWREYTLRQQLHNWGSRLYHKFR